MKNFSRGHEHAIIKKNWQRDLVMAGLWTVPFLSHDWNCAGSRQGTISMLREPIPVCHDWQHRVYYGKWNQTQITKSSLVIFLVHTAMVWSTCKENILLLSWYSILKYRPWKIAKSKICISKSYQQCKGKIRSLYTIQECPGVNLSNVCCNIHRAVKYVK